MKPLLTYFAAGLTLLTTGCATTEFSPYEARSNAFVEGQGGTKAVVDGMDVWTYGEPPRRFTVVGVIDAEEPGGATPTSRTRRLHANIVKKAKEAGGDAVIQVGSDSRITGVYNTGATTATVYGNSATSYGSGVSVPIVRNTGRFLVIKYADGER